MLYRNVVLAAMLVLSGCAGMTEQDTTVITTAAKIAAGSVLEQATGTKAYNALANAAIDTAVTVAIAKANAGETATSTVE